MVGHIPARCDDPLTYLCLHPTPKELRDTTNNVLYEDYRSAKLMAIAAQSQLQTADGTDPMSLLEAERKEHEAKMKKLEMEMQTVFEQKVGAAVPLVVSTCDAFIRSVNSNIRDALDSHRWESHHLTLYRGSNCHTNQNVIEGRTDRDTELTGDRSH